MPKLTGMELATLLPPHTKIVFTTAYSEYAVESYAFHTIDYLLKPITLKRFLASVEKIEQHFLKPGPEYLPNAEQGPDFFFVTSGKTLRKNTFIKATILYFEGEKRLRKAGDRPGTDADIPPLKGYGSATKAPVYPGAQLLIVINYEQLSKNRRQPYLYRR